MNNSAPRWSLLTLPRFDDIRGVLTVAESQAHVPFDIQRVYTLTHVPLDTQRAGHAHRTLTQAMIAVSGSFRVTLDDGQAQAHVWLSRPDRALLIPPGVWREIDHFSHGAVCLVLASAAYDEDDYIRDKVSFKEAMSHDSLS